MCLANQNPIFQVLIWDQTPNDEGKVLMNSLRDPANPANDHPSINQHTFFTDSKLGLLEVHSGGWKTPRRRGVTRIYVVLEGPNFVISSIAKIPGTFKLNFKHFI